MKPNYLNGQYRPLPTGNAHEDLAWRTAFDAIYSLQANMAQAAAALDQVRSTVPSYQQIRQQLQAGGLTPLNTTGLLPPTTILSTHALRISSYPASSYSHAMYFETDRTALYASNGSAWTLVEGVSYGTLESRWGDLGAADTNFLYIQSAANNTNSTIPYPVSRWNGANWVQISGNQRNLFVQTATVTIANSNAETSIVGSGVGSMTLPANFFQVGTSVEVSAQGYHSATGNPNVTFNFKVDGNTVVTSGTVASGASTNQLLDAKIYMTCRTTGNNGTVSVQGYYREWDPSPRLALGMVATSLLTLNTANTHAIDMTFTWGTAAAGDTASWTNITMNQVA